MDQIRGGDVFKTCVTLALESIGENSIEDTIQDVLNKHLTENEKNNSDYLGRLHQEVLSEIEGFGPIHSLLQDVAVTEVCINDFDKIFYEKGGNLFPLNDQFLSPLVYGRFIKNLLKKIGKTGDTRHPLVDGVLDPAMRIHLSLPPASPVPAVTIRKHNHFQWNLDDLMLQKMFTQSFLARMKLWIEERKNILVCGATGSGKTTLMRAMLLSCPRSERIISLEDTPELGSLGSHHVNLLTRHDPEELVPSIDLSLLLRNSLRMRPDRIVVGEVRGVEALTLLDVLSTGHRGAICTLHAHSPQHALKRLESLILRASSQWSMQAVRQLITDSIDVVVICSKKNGLRFVSQTALLRGAEDFGYLLEILN